GCVRAAGEGAVRVGSVAAAADGHGTDGHGAGCHGTVRHGTDAVVALDPAAASAGERAVAAGPLGHGPIGPGADGARAVGVHTARHRATGVRRPDLRAAVHPGDPGVLVAAGDDAVGERAVRVDTVDHDAVRRVAVGPGRGARSAGGAVAV